MMLNEVVRKVVQSLQIPFVNEPWFFNGSNSRFYSGGNEISWAAYVAFGCM